MENYNDKIKEETWRKWYNLAEKSIAGIYIYDENLNLLYVNPSICKMLGMPREEILKKKINEIVYKEDIHLIEEMARKRFSCEEEEEEEEEIRWIDKEGKLRYGRFSGIVTEFEGKRVVVGTVVDITEMREYEEKLRDEQKLLEKTLEGTIHAIVEIVETKDPYTAGHQVRVSKLSVAIAKKMGLENIREILWSSLLHDVGKISVPDDILVLPRKLTPIEFEIVKTHSITGYNIVKVIPGMEKVAEIILQHHERLDGTGYPKGLKGEEILKEARIIGVSDVVEAMVNHRPYRPALSLNDALEEIYKNRGIKYDKEVVEVCIELFLSRKFSFEEPF